MDCFSDEISISDQTSDYLGLFETQKSRILRILQKCFPTGQIEYKNYFGIPNQRMICIYIIDRDGKIQIKALAFLVLDLENNNIFIHSVCVPESSRGQRCCNRLFLYIVKNYGQYDLFLEVRVGKFLSEEGLNANETACNCYSKFGFMFVPNRLCSLYADGINCLMKRPKNGFVHNDDFYRVVKCNNQRYPTQILEQSEILISRLSNIELKWVKIDNDHWLWVDEYIFL